MSVTHCTVGGVNITTPESAIELSVEVVPDRVATTRRMSNGDLIALRPSGATKKRITISGRGRYPPALDALDWAAAQTVTFTRHTAAGPTTASYSLKSDGPTETGQPTRVSCSWSLSGREV
jgi:hypothetical protein